MSAARRRPEVFYIARRSPVAPVAPVPGRAGLQRAIVLRRERPDVMIRDDRGVAVVLGPSHVDAARDAIARTRRGELVRVRLYDPRGVCEGPPPVALTADELERLDVALARLATLSAPENA